MKIAIGGDHAGFALKAMIIAHLTEHEMADMGPHSDQSCDYPDFAHPLAQKVAAGDAERGILICGSGNGVCMTANKHPGIRAALCWDTELVTLARQHNNANVLCIPARFLGADKAMAMVDLFLNTPFEGGRHQNRVAKVDLL